MSALILTGLGVMGLGGLALLALTALGWLDEVDRESEGDADCIDARGSSASRDCDCDW